MTVRVDSSEVHPSLDHIWTMRKTHGGGRQASIFFPYFKGAILKELPPYVFLFSNQILETAHKDGKGEGNKTKSSDRHNKFIGRMINLIEILIILTIFLWTRNPNH